MSARPALLALHGFTGSGATWDALREALGGVEMLAPDLPGHGAAPAGADASVEATSDGLAALVERLGHRPIDVLGYSLGARVALRLAVAHPEAVRRLVLEAPSAGIPVPGERAARRAADEERARLLEARGLAAFLAQWEREPVLAAEASLPPEVRLGLRVIRELHAPAGLAASLRAAGQGAMEPLHDRLARVTAPTLVIVGSDDPARPRAEAVAAAIPDARVAVVPQAGHAVHLHQPERFVALVRDFLEEPLS